MKGLIPGTHKDDRRGIPARVSDISASWPTALLGLLVAGFAPKGRAMGGCWGRSWER